MKHKPSRERFSLFKSTYYSNVGAEKFWVSLMTLGEAGDCSASPCRTYRRWQPLPLSSLITLFCAFPFLWPLRPSFSGLEFSVGHAPVWSLFRPEVHNPFVCELFQLSAVTVQCLQITLKRWSSTHFTVAMLLQVSLSTSAILLSLGLP